MFSDQLLKKYPKLNLVTKVHDGFFQVNQFPTQNEVNDHYHNKYYQNNSGNYQQSYSKEEIEYHINFGKRFEAWVPEDITEKTMLDVGCGEGFCMNQFLKSGYTVRGLDFSKDGMERHNKHLTEFTTFGDVYQLLDEMIESGELFSVVVLKHVLEHVLDPKKLLNRLKSIVSPNGIVIVVVPNDFSNLQMKLLEEETITPFWISPPEHLSYWNHNGLRRFVNENGWNVVNYTSDYPIDFDLLVNHTNYNQTPKVGKCSHLKRVRVTNLLCNESPKKCNDYFKTLSEMGFGRELIYFIRPNQI